MVWMWRPVKICMHRLHITLSIKTSLIKIFATFILLSYVKIFGVSLQILSFTPTYNVAGNKMRRYYTLYDGTEQYFGSTHLPYAVVALVMCAIFVVLPFFLLAAYPCRCFHKCLNCCGLRSQVFHVFMDTFLGSYKTEPRDLRCFSALYLLLRMLVLAQPHFFPSQLMLFTSGKLGL